MDNSELKKQRDEWAYLIEQYIIGRNAWRDRDILISNWLDGISLEKLADKYGLSTRQVNRIVAKRELELIDIVPIQQIIKKITKMS